MNKDIARVLALQGFQIGETIVTENELIINVSSPRVTADCTNCGNKSSRVYQYRYRSVKHGLVEKRIIVLKIKYRRFLCKKCNKVFTESLPSIDPKRVTVHGRETIIQNLSQQSFNKTAKQFSVSEASVNRYLLEIFANYQPDFSFERKGLVLGLDEHSFRGHDMVTTITNLSKRKIIGILKDDRQETIRGYLSNLPITTKESIIEVCMDMRFGFRIVVEEVLPKANIVVDPFHVIAAANRTVDELRSVLVSGKEWHPKIRRLLMKNREHLSFEESIKLMEVFEKCRKFPALEIAWRAKEKLREMYQSKDKQEATHKFNLVLSYLSDTHSHYLNSFRGTLERWKVQILNHFDNRTTNAFTEGCHTKIKLNKRMSYGFKNVNNYIAKMLLAFVPIAILMHHHFC